MKSVDEKEIENKGLAGLVDICIRKLHHDLDKAQDHINNAKKFLQYENLDLTRITNEMGYAGNILNYNKFTLDIIHAINLMLQDAIDTVLARRSCEITKEF